MGKKKLTWDEKRDLVHQKVRVNFNGIMTWGYVSGSKRNFPVVFCNEYHASFEVSWDLAYRAVNEGAIING